MKTYSHALHFASGTADRVLRVISALVCVFGLLAASAAAQRETVKPEAGRTMTDGEKMASWKGEKVILIGYPPGHNFRSMGIDSTYPYPPDPVRGFGGQLPVEKYDRKTGVITEVDPESRLVITLDDSGEKIVATGEYSLGFFAERKIAEELVGRTLWAKGTQWLYAPGSDPRVPYEQRITFRVAPASRLTVTRVDWGVPFETVVVHLKTEDGQEGGLFFDWRTCLDPRFHTTRTSRDVCRKSWSLSDDFFAEDPRKLYPKWTEATWKLIEQGMIAIGMNEDMVKVVCGLDLLMTGAVLSPEGEASPIYTCGRRRFLVSKGKVEKYVEEK